AVGVARAGVDVEPPRAAGPGAVEVEGGDARLLILEEGRAEVAVGGVHPRPEVHGGLPTEVVVDVRAVRGPDVRVAKAPQAGRMVQQPVPVAREAGGAFVAAAVDERPEVHRLAPRGVLAGAAGHPEVVAALAAGAVRAEVQAQAVLGDTRPQLARRGVDDRAEVDGRAPRAELAGERPGFQGFEAQFARGRSRVRVASVHGRTLLFRAVCDTRNTPAGRARRPSARAMVDSGSVPATVSGRVSLAGSACRGPGRGFAGRR